MFPHLIGKDQVKFLRPLACFIQKRAFANVMLRISELFVAFEGEHLAPIAGYLGDLKGARMKRLDHLAAGRAHDDTVEADHRDIPLLRTVTFSENGAQDYPVGCHI
ncbi:hypothetical protein [Sulfitobacter sp. SK012]|uniref:hypothetical protein n=1 Tax=Sulfitobacter sp. SK012 TaxID=1389005 RepID=UPI002692FAD3